jgi:hypothetical protein
MPVKHGTTCIGKCPATQQSDQPPSATCFAGKWKFNGGYCGSTGVALLQQAAVCNMSINVTAAASAE